MTRNRILGVVAAGAAATAIIIGWQFLPHQTGSQAEASTQTTVSEETTTEVRVERGDLTSDYDFTGQVSFGESWMLPLSTEGVVTGSRPQGTVIDFGDVLVEVAGEPVYLAAGDLPMYRELALTGTHMEGEDVAQLQRFLLAAGSDDDGRLEVDGNFGPSTRRAVKEWQEEVGREQTGRVDATQLVFSPTPLRIETAARVGTTFEGLEVTEATPTVTVEIDSDQRTQIPIDGDVIVEPGEGATVEGVVVDHERIVGENGSTSWQAVIELDGEIDDDETSVLVYSTVVDASGVLIVPTSALLAVAEGGFAVEVVDGTDTRLVPVEVGEVVQARAEIIGDIQPGDMVAVPS